MKKLILFIIVIAALGGGWYWYKHRPAKPETIYFRSQEVVRASVTQDVTATGTISPIKKVEVATQVTGKVISLSADYNSHVKAGQLIAVIDPQTKMERVITPYDAAYEDPSWAPDGRHIAAARSVRYQSAIYLLDTEGDKPVALTTAGDWRAPAWTH